MSKRIKQWFALSTLSLACLAPQMSFAQTTAWQNAPFSVYEVPAISSVKRLPDAKPTDGKLTNSLRIIAAKGEFEPTSFVITPRENIDKLEIKATDLKMGSNTIPASSVDIKIVKIWYQGGTSWYSYFGDSNRRELVPELLLNDETLIKVDTQTKDNYLRIGSEYQSVSYTDSKDKTYFNYFTEPVADSKTLQPVALKTGENKQIWVTVKVPKTAAAGNYTGQITLSAAGKRLGTMTLNVHVLPFELPMPKTYYNINNDFLTTMYGSGIYELAGRMGIPLEETDRIQMDMYKNLLDHNIFNNRVDLALSNQNDRAGAIKALQHEVKQIVKAGFVTKPLLTCGWGYPVGNGGAAEYEKRIVDYKNAITEIVGHSDIYITSWDEAGPDRIKIMRPVLEFAQKQGLKVWLTTRAGHHFDLEGYLIDYANHGGWPQKKQADTWHAVGSKVTSYAGPHTGPENPVVFRKFEGLARYKANYDGSFNYIWYSGHHTSLYERQKGNVWNDFRGGAFRGFNLIYPTKAGPIDTIAWEGFREGIDDIRYATKLKQEAAAAIASSNVEAGFVAKKALIWLELLDANTADLNMARMEMIDHILKIQKAMGK